MMLVCGARDWKDETLILETLQKYPDETYLVHGACSGADKLAERAARKLEWGIVSMTPSWKKQGLKAGPLRNSMMLEMRPSIVLAFHDKIEDSKGTIDCMEEANRRGIPVFLVSHASPQPSRWRRKG